jgi:pimeloyl-ACP methyl ester carboxylesterase
MTPITIIRNACILVFVAAIVFTGNCFAQQANNDQKITKKTGYAPVNGLKIYYEVQGEGKPILLLHGSFYTIEMNWSQLLPELTKTRKVIAIEMQGHGRTADSDKPISHQSLASDVAGVMKYLKIDSADILGYSLGGRIAFQLAIQHPELVKKLIILSSTYRADGWQPEARAALQSIQPEFLDNTPLRTEYFRVAPDTIHWHKFLSKILAFNNTNYNLGDENIKSIKAPVLLIAGDNDGIDKTILTNTYKLLGGGLFGDMAGIPKSQLAVIPATTHVSIMYETGKILSVINSFLK